MKTILLIFCWPFADCIHPKLLTAYTSRPLRKLTVLVEAFVLAAIIVTTIAINPQWKQTMAASVQIADPIQESAIGKIIAFAQAAGTVALLTVHPQSAKSWPQ